MNLKCMDKSLSTKKYLGKSSALVGYSGSLSVVKVQNQRWGTRTFKFGPRSVVVCFLLAL